VEKDFYAVYIFIGYSRVYFLICHNIPQDIFDNYFDAAAFQEEGSSNYINLLTKINTNKPIQGKNRPNLTGLIFQ